MFSFVPGILVILRFFATATSELMLFLFLMTTNE